MILDNAVGHCTIQHLLLSKSFVDPFYTKTFLICGDKEVSFAATQRLLLFWVFESTLNSENKMIYLLGIQRRLYNKLFDNYSMVLWS